MAGWAEQTPAGWWRLTPHVTQIAERLRVQIAEAHGRYLALPAGGWRPGAARTAAAGGETTDA